MTIEFHVGQIKAEEKLIDYIKEKLVALSHLHHHISRAEVYLHEYKELRKENKVCEIRLDIFGETVFVRRESGQYKKSATEVLKELKKLVKEQVKHQNDPPDITTSTVKV
ncbi:MAG TPA: HPF/RaiA family ribosome-associated protein [Chitinophagaceae bacterium]|nr:HPF/RaiA family ribosome-associated protein [Chitinophagaceae bacterium]